MLVVIDRKYEPLGFTASPCPHLSDSAGHCIVWQGLFRREAPLMVRTNATDPTFPARAQKR